MSSLASFSSGVSRGRTLSIHGLALGLMTADVVTTVATGLISSFVIDRFGISPASAEILEDRLIISLLAVGLYVLFARVLSAHRPSQIIFIRYVLTRVCWALFLTFGSFILLGALIKITANYSRVWFFSWMTCAFVCTIATHFYVQLRVKRLLAHGAAIYRAISIGYRCDPLSAVALMQYTNNTVLTAASLKASNVDEVERLALACLEAGPVDQLHIRVAWQDVPEITKNLGSLRAHAAQVFVVPDCSDLHDNVRAYRNFGQGLSMVVVERPIEGWDIVLKRLEDIVLSSIIVLLMSPVLAIAALAILLESPGPILFRQKRIGFNGYPFEIWKFRSMFVEHTDPDASKQTSRNDLRVTRVGRFIRATSIDELPQFFNVLQGPMSIVGPRPHAIKTMTEGQPLQEIVEEYAYRHRVKPGITGLAQISGFRGELDSVEKVQGRVDYDLHYIENWSIWMDVTIIARTALLVFRDPAAF